MEVAQEQQERQRGLEPPTEELEGLEVHQHQLPDKLEGVHPVGQEHCSDSFP